jgi:DNA repair exonuclease SbcCD nuclease subunit
MSKIYVISDTHINNFVQFNSGTVVSEYSGINSRCNNILNAIKDCAKQAIAEGAEALIIPGDVFHTRGILPVAVYNAAYKTFQEISKKISIIFTPGNHDFVSSTTVGSDEGLHSLYGFKEFAVVAHVPEHFVTDSFSISLIPFIPNKDGTVAAAEKLYKIAKKEKGKFHLVFFHHSFKDAETGPINFKMPYELEYTDIPAFDGKYSGHLHKHQRVGPANTGLVYIGGPVHHDVGERNYVPGWLSIDNKGTYTQIENKVSPRFVVLETDSEKELNKLNASDYKVIKWTGEEAVGYKLRGSKENIKVEITPKQSKVLSRSTISSTDSVENMARKYMESKLGKVDELLLKYGLDEWRS